MPLSSHWMILRRHLSPCWQRSSRSHRNARKEGSPDKPGLTRNPSWIQHCPNPALPHLHCLAHRALISPRGGNHCFNTYTPINLGENIRRRHTFDALQRLVVRWIACPWSKDTEVLLGVKRQRNNPGWIIPLGDGGGSDMWDEILQGILYLNLLRISDFVASLRLGQSQYLLLVDYQYYTF